MLEADGNGLMSSNLLLEVGFMVRFRWVVGGFRLTWIEFSELNSFLRLPIAFSVVCIYDGVWLDRNLRHVQ